MIAALRRLAQESISADMFAGRLNRPTT